MKWFNSKFQEFYHNPGTFNSNVTKDFGNETIILRDMVESTRVYEFIQQKAPSPTSRGQTPIWRRGSYRVEEISLISEELTQLKGNIS